MGSINDFFDEEPFVQCRIRFQEEIHTKSGCHYEPLFDWCIVGTNIRVKILIRICICGMETDRRTFLERTSILFSEIGDGVECHFNDACTFKEPDLQIGIPDFRKNEIRKFRKACHCTRAKLSNIR